MVYNFVTIYVLDENAYETESFALYLFKFQFAF